MKKELRKFQTDRRTEKKYYRLAPHFVKELDFLADEYLKLKKDFPNRDKVYYEEFNDPI